jgi:hypothetical protein
MKMMRGILQQETVLEDKHKGSQNYHKLVQRLTQKTKGDHAQKKANHLLRKQQQISRVQPGAYQNIYKQSDFAIQKKQDFLQFFGTTDSKIKEDNFLHNRNTLVGPGTYNAYDKSFANAKQKRANTASFNSNRKDLLFNGNNNPGPQAYGNVAHSFTSKNWQTNIGAFGTTEKKFASTTAASEVSDKPGPGAYKATTFVHNKFKTKKIRG